MLAAHDTVLLHEAVDALIGNPAGLYVDGTFGRGGHSREILRRLAPAGRLLAIDKDHEAAAVAEDLMLEDDRVSFYRGAFSALPQLLSERGLDSVDGVLLDLGVSSPQLDNPKRGFSFQQDGPLDMRMDCSTGESAAEWLARVDEADLVTVLREYGEERYAKRIAAAIVRERDLHPLTRTAQLAAVVKEAHPRWEKHRHPATKSFQAIRIKVNQELDELAALLDAALAILRVGGRLIVISFHSLEDRMVKRFMREAARGPVVPRHIPIRDSETRQPLRILGKAQRASDDEIQGNRRARSAVMRCAERLA